MYEVGDRVRMLSAFRMGTEKGEIYTVEKIDVSDDTISLSETRFGTNWVYTSDVEKVEIEKESKQMTFPEMAQKLIDGEFEVGTELVSSNRKDSKYEVVKSEYGYGFVNVDISLPSYINAKWTVKEQPIKEMSIEDIQKELGYKIKITE